MLVSVQNLIKLCKRKENNFVITDCRSRFFEITKNGIYMGADLNVLKEYVVVRYSLYSLISFKNKIIFLLFLIRANGNANRWKD